jgi:hypothetical protein
VVTRRPADVGVGEAIVPVTNVLVEIKITLAVQYPVLQMAGFETDAKAPPGYIIVAIIILEALAIEVGRVFVIFKLGRIDLYSASESEFLNEAVVLVFIQRSIPPEPVETGGRLVVGRMAGWGI